MKSLTSNIQHCTKGMNRLSFRQSLEAVIARIPFRDNKRHFYRKSLIIVLLITSLPTALIGAGIYYFGITQIEQEVNRTHQVQVRQAVRTMDGTLSHLETTVAQWAFNPIFDESLKEFPFSLLFERTMDLYKSLSVLRGSDPLIDRVYLYLSDTAQLISNEDGIQPMKDDPDHTAYRSMMDKNKTMFWTDELPVLKNDASQMMLVHKLPRRNGQSMGALIVYLDQSKVTRMLRESSGEDQIASFLLKDDGKPIFTLRNQGSLTSELEEALRSEAVVNRKKTDSYVYTWKNEEYSLSYGNLNRTGSTWTYVTAVPLNQLTKPVAILSRLIIAISLLGLLTAIMLSWLASKQMYRPIQRLLQTFRAEGIHGKAISSTDAIDEIEYMAQRWKHLNTETDQLEETLKRQLPHLREGFLLQLIQGHLYSLSEEHIRERMEQFGWDVSGNGKEFSVMLVRLLGLIDNTKFHEGDEQLVSFSAANIIGELAKELPDTESSVMNFQDLTVGVLFVHPTNRDEGSTKQHLSVLAEQIQSALESLLRMHVTLLIGKLTGSVKAIPSTFQEAIHALGYRDLQQTSQIIDMDLLISMDPARVNYPFELEFDIIQAIRNEEEEEAERCLRAFITALSDSTGKEFSVRHGMLQLLGTIQHAYLKSGFNLYIHEESGHLHEQLLELYEPKAMVRFMRQKVFQPYWEEMRGMKDAHDLQLKQTVEAVVEMLTHQYMQDDISLESCADVHGIHPYTLSKAFKQLTSINFIDYLTDLRMNHSRKLLIDTDMKINDVAIQVGYQPSYFNRIFKKHEGITPSQYRQRLRS
jgi:AraC-like DNA-binding protein